MNLINSIMAKLFKTKPKSEPYIVLWGYRSIRAGGVFSYSGATSINATSERDARERFLTIHPDRNINGVARYE